MKQTCQANKEEAAVDSYRDVNQPTRFATSPQKQATNIFTKSPFKTWHSSYTIKLPNLSNIPPSPTV
eukprot:scaffold2914_cov156-Ochromonas_danica.AAC.6